MYYKKEHKDLATKVKTVFEKLNIRLDSVKLKQIERASKKGAEKLFEFLEKEEMIHSFLEINTMDNLLDGVDKKYVALIEVDGKYSSLYRPKNLMIQDGHFSSPNLVKSEFSNYGRMWLLDF